MKRYGFYILMVLLLVSEVLLAQKRKERKEAFNSSYNYEISVQAVGVDGTKVYKVWGYGKKVEDAILNAKRSAVAAVIFKDIPARPEWRVRLPFARTMPLRSMPAGLIPFLTMAGPGRIM